jgi:hypothetical protein
MSANSTGLLNGLQEGMILRAAVYALLALTSASISAAELPHAVLAGLRAAGIPASSVAVVVQEVGSAAPELSVRAAPR